MEISQGLRDRLKRTSKGERMKTMKANLSSTITTNF
jgi:hypothetical protein